VWVKNSRRPELVWVVDQQRNTWGADLASASSMFGGCERWQDRNARSPEAQNGSRLSVVEDTSQEI
jgi:hypothetical protein